MPNHVNKAKAALHQEADPEYISTLKRFFKTGAGDYSERDIFIGVRMPKLRKVAKAFIELDHNSIISLLQSEIHEERLLALLILTYQYSKFPELQQQIYTLYLDQTDRINNWDLVDLSCYKIVGPYLVDRSRNPLYKLAKSDSLWERRISIVSTYTFIRLDQFDDTLALSKILLSDTHDLIHKAVGWMLREVAKRDQSLVEGYLRENYESLPRTTLRYAIERFPENLRKSYLSGKVS